MSDHAQRCQCLTVSLVIPVRNEARNIAWVLEQIADDVNEIILVDGNSTDATLITARSYRPDIKVVPQEGIGKGSALRTGFLAATGDIIVMMDADGSMAPQEIRHYLHFLTNGYDFVKGSRFIARRRVVGHHSFSAARQPVLAGRVQHPLRRRPDRPVLRLLRVSPSLFGASGPFGDRVSRSRPRWSCGQCRQVCGSQRCQVSSCRAGRANRTSIQFGMASECCALYCAATAHAFRNSYQSLSRTAKFPDGKLIPTRRRVPDEWAPAWGAAT